MEPYVGEIRMFGGGYAPRDWALCDGQILAIAANQALFSLIGATYGGDGRVTFGLPDLRGRVTVSQGTNPRTGSTYRLGGRHGQETVTLTKNQLPSHTHVAYANGSAGEDPSPENAVWAGGSPYSTNTPPDGQMSADAVTSTGNNQAHENMAPFLAVGFIISLRGIYPTQS